MRDWVSVQYMDFSWNSSSLKGPVKILGPISQKVKINLKFDFCGILRLKSIVRLIWSLCETGPRCGRLLNVTKHWHQLKFFAYFLACHVIVGYDVTWKQRLFYVQYGTVYKRQKNCVYSRNSAIYKIMHCYLGQIVVHFLSTCDWIGFYTWIHRSLGVKFCT